VGRKGRAWQLESGELGAAHRVFFRRVATSFPSISGIQAEHTLRQNPKFLTRCYSGIYGVRFEQERHHTYAFRLWD